MREEIKSILKMIEEGNITAEEGAELINQLQSTNVEVIDSQKQTKSQFIHIEVQDENAKQLVKVNVPLALAKTVLKIGAVEKQISMHAPGIELDFEEIIKMIESDVQGEIVNIESDQHTVRIWID